jgi:putative phosphotransacetylase
MEAKEELSCYTREGMKNVIHRAIADYMERVGGVPFQVEIDKKGIKTGVSNRHVHLSQEDLDTLFGEGHELTPLRELTQEKQFVAEETVAVATPRGTLENVHVLGPVRAHTQMEISRTNGYQLGIFPPVRMAAGGERTPDVTLIGPKGSVRIDRGVIMAHRHIHMPPEDARYFGVKEGDRVMLWAPGERGVIFDNVLIRVDPTFYLEFHVDSDEANAALLKNGDPVYVLRRSDSIPFPGSSAEKTKRQGRIFITEEKLREMLAHNRALTLGEHEILTPQARDLARKHGLI